MTAAQRAEETEQGRERGRARASHGPSLAQKLAGGVTRAARSAAGAVTAAVGVTLAALAVLTLAGLAAAACAGDPGPPPVDPDDVDGDGVPNAQDVCPGVNDPAQHDEDGDGVGDLCDVCPTVADPEQSDRGEVDAVSFADGVGDACDPRPSAGGDRVSALHTFATDTTPAWIGAGFTIGGDRLRAAAAAPARWLYSRPAAGDSIAARLAVESVAWDVAGAGALSIALDGGGLETSRVCAVYADRDGDGNDELEARELGAGGAVAVRALPGRVTGPFTLIAQRGVDRRQVRGVVLCRVAVPGDPDPPPTVTIPTSDDSTTGQYAVAAADADVVATSLIAYASPYACPTLALACDGPPPP